MEKRNPILSHESINKLPNHNNKDTNYSIAKTPDSLIIVCLRVPVHCYVIQIPLQKKLIPLIKTPVLVNARCDIQSGVRRWEPTKHLSTTVLGLESGASG